MENEATEGKINIKDVSSKEGTQIYSTLMVTQVTKLQALAFMLVNSPRPMVIISATMDPW